MGCLKLIHQEQKSQLKVVKGFSFSGEEEGAGIYRYGFQSQERDDEIKGPGNSYNYTYRMHDPRLGRFFAVDPLFGDYPELSTYQFASNQVIKWRELEGLEAEGKFERYIDERNAEYLSAGDDQKYYQVLSDLEQARYEGAEMAVGVFKTIGLAVLVVVAPEVGVPLALTELSGAPVLPSPQAYATVVTSATKGALTTESSIVRAEQTVVNAERVEATVIQAEKTVVNTSKGANAAKTEGIVAPTAAESGKIYRVPGNATRSGKPYVGRTRQASPTQRGRGSNDGRDRTKAEIIDTYNPSKSGQGPYKEQRAIDNNGGVNSLDNKRNEVNPNRMRELENQYGGG